MKKSQTRLLISNDILAFSYYYQREASLHKRIKVLSIKKQQMDNNKKVLTKNFSVQPQMRQVNSLKE